MRRTSGFTLVEMLVSVALVLFIMVILTEAFGKGLDSFRTLKAIGDMESKLRMAASTLRRDLMADHFEGKRRLSDPAARWSAMGAPREGFFRHAIRPAPFQQNVAEGGDTDGLRSTRSVHSVLHFTVKLRGNDRAQFFTATLPQNSPLFRLRSTFFDLPSDARFQDTGLVYSSQWAEVAYWLEPTGSANGNIPLYTLYRSQFVICADNSNLNWPNLTVTESVPNSSEYDEISCTPATNAGQRQFYINNPTDINDRLPGSTPPRHRRAFYPLLPTTRGATPLLSDVVHFGLWTGEFDGGTGNPVGFPASDTHPLQNQAGGTFAGVVPRIAITLRVWDSKSKQTRQMTIIQDL